MSQEFHNNMAFDSSKTSTLTDTPETVYEEAGNVFPNTTETFATNHPNPPEYIIEDNHAPTPTIENQEMDNSKAALLESEETEDNNLNARDFAEIPINKWTDSHWDYARKLAEQNLSGEELMKVFAFKRRKDLESLFYKLSERLDTFLKINWLADVSCNEHALPDLKASKDGALRISATRFKRMGLDVTEGMYFDMEKISDKQFSVTLHPRP